MVEADGGPVSVVVAGASVPDLQLLEETVEALIVARPWPRPTMFRTSGGSARRNSTREDASGIPRADGSSSGRWVG